MNKPAVTVLIAGGGTGGHIFPGLAVAEALLASGAKVVWLGAGGMETQLVSQRDLPLFTVSFSAPKRWWHLSRLIPAVWRALGVLAKVKPAAVLCMGGYASVPGGLAAKLRGLPLIVHEQNAVLGKANRLLAKFATAVLAGFPEVSGATHYVGNPVRSAFDRCGNRARDRACRCILLLGGSQGAQVLNETAPGAFALLRQQRADLSIVHQCGKGHLEQTRARYEQLKLPAGVYEFIEDVPAAMAAADVVICRAGAATLAELAAAGVGAVLVPYPHAAADHQRLNARRFEACGAAVVCEQQGLTEQKLAQLLTQLDAARLAAAARQLAMPQAAAQVVQHCLQEVGHAA